MRRSYFVRYWWRTNAFVTCDAKRLAIISILIVYNHILAPSEPRGLKTQHSDDGKDHVVDQQQKEW